VAGAGKEGLARAASVVGRDRELARLADVVRVGQRGEAACVLVVGEGGIGKTRILDETAALSRDTAVLVGRAPITTPAPYSVIAEALRSWLRNHPVDEPMVPYDRGLGLVLPEWPVVDPVDLDAASRRLLACEGIVQLLRHVIAQVGAVVLILDDLHAVDPDSIEIVRYLAAADLDGLVIVGALRPNTSAPADDLVRVLRQEGRADVIDLVALDERSVGDLLASLLGASAPSPLVADILARTDGVPLLVEELLRGHVSAGTITVDASGATWHGGAANVPGTIRDLVGARLAALTERERDVLVAGAVIGDFEPTLMRAVTGATDDVIADALAAGMQAGVLETVDGAIAFRHAIVREAVLASAVPHVVDSLHRRAASALDTADGGADVYERQARHLAALGARDDAAAALALAADAWVHDHALLAGERAARAANELAASPSVRAEAADSLARALAAQGRWADALAIDEATAAAHGDTSERRLRRIECAIDAGEPDRADEVLRDALANGDDEPRLLLAAGRIALVRGDAAAALDAGSSVMSTRGVEIDDRLGALDLTGRAYDYLGDRDEAKQAWTQQAAEARAAGRTQGELRALVQLGKVELFAGEAPDRLVAAVELARDAGALVELAWGEENLAIAYAVQGDPPRATALLDEAIERFRPFQLDQLTYLVAARAMTRTYVVDGAEAEFDVIDAAAPTPDVLLQTAGMRGDVAVRAREWEEAIKWFDRSAAIASTMPGVVPLDGACWRPLVLAAAGRPDEAAAALDEARAIPDLARFHTRPVTVAVAEAALAGDAAGVDAALAAAPGRMPMDKASLQVMCAHIIGGPDRVRWLRNALDIYEAAGATREADRTRRALREAGGAVPRRRRSPSAVPTELAAAGVTAREAEVLALIGEGLPNRDIASRLYLSVRTVEAHVASLLTKLDARNRAALASRAASISFSQGSP
jgi:DNA-binding CsgD family transcriptional regulator/tetratricopeptide (TPR) repeat protein